VGALAGPLAEAGSACAKAVTDIGGAVADTAATAPDVEVLGEATAAVDASAVIQGGVDVPDDIVAGGLTLTTAEAVIGLLITLALAIAYIIFLWQQTMNLIAGSPMPQLPKAPTVTPPQMSLSPEQENLAQRLYADYGKTTGLTLDDIRDIIANNPKLTEKQLRALLDQYSTVIKNHPNLVKLAGGPLQLFLLFIQLAYDPAKISPKANLAKGIHEAEVVLDLAEQGKLRWPIKRDPSGDAEIIDGNNQAWDIKSYTSGMNPPFNLEKALNAIKQELNIAHENVILDVSQLSPEDAKALYQAVQKEGWGGKILWWPAPPAP